MKSTCIITDGSVQFIKANYPGQALVKTIPLEIQIEGKSVLDGNGAKPSSLPQYASQQLNPHVFAPSIEQFYQLFLTMSQSYDNILGIFSSNQLIPCYENAQKASINLQGRTKIILIDSMTISAGLGFLVQLAADGIAKGIPVYEVERQIRSILPSTYSIICPAGLSYLYFNGFVDQSQAVVNEMLGLFPIFAIENGKLIPLEKVKSSRNAVGFFQEFLDEFEQLSHIAFIQSALSTYQESKILRDNYQRESPTPYSEHVINLPMAALFGPRTLGMIIVESQNVRKR
jgi:DegV family protein with EDD domain